MNVIKFIKELFVKGWELWNAKGRTTVEIVEKSVKPRLVKTTAKHLETVAINHGCEWNKTINIVGFGNIANPGKWNDFIYLFYEGDVYRFKATTDPSVHFTKKPLNQDGAAHMCFGYHRRIWKIGKHRGKYSALVQTGGKVKVWRDKNQDFLNNDGIVQRGYFGINLHHGYNSKGNIGRHSAGCQVIRDIKPHQFFMSITKKSGHKTFSYTLIDQALMPYDLRIGGTLVK